MVSLPFTLFLTKSSGFLTFENTIEILRFDFTSITIALVGSVATMILVQLFNMLFLLRKRTVEDYGVVEQAKPSFYKYYLDVIMIGLGIIMWIVYNLPIVEFFRFSIVFG